MKIERLLLIDDDELNNYIVNCILEDTKLANNFNFKTDGENALQYLYKCQATQQFPDLILVDLKMPIMDGFEFIEQYEKRFLQASPQTQLIVVTSSIREIEKQKALNFKSVKNFINKPLNEEKLKYVIECYYKNVHIA